MPSPGTASRQGDALPEINIKRFTGTAYTGKPPQLASAEYPLKEKGFRVDLSTHLQKPAIALVE
jgi:hypothetical protein